MIKSDDLHKATMMSYKFQGLGAGPITPRRLAELIAFTVAMIAVYVVIALLLAGCSADPRCPQGTGYTWKCVGEQQLDCGCKSNPGGA